jgi:hypothetical protein
MSALRAVMATESPMLAPRVLEQWATELIGRPVHRGVGGPQCGAVQHAWVELAPGGTLHLVADMEIEDAMFASQDDLQHVWVDLNGPRV